MLPLKTHYSFIWVSVSVLIATSASIAALFLLDRERASSSAWLRRFWLLTASIALGLGVWAMHFLGMLAVTLPVPIFYHWPTVTLSFLLALGACGVALWTASTHGSSPARLLAGGTVLGGGICAMHYTGMAAMRSAATAHYTALSVLLALFIAVVVSMAAVWLAFRPEHHGLRLLTTAAGGTVLGIGITIMHYVAMSGVSFTREQSSGMPGGSLVHVDDLGRVLITLGVGLVLAFAFSMGGLDILRNLQLRRAEIALMEKDALLVDQNKLREVNSLLSELSIKDSLTGLYNRRYFDSALQTEWNRASRALDRLALLMMDLDCFKALNDHYGHPAGDACLRDVARCLQEHQRRSYDVLARYGGEEFVLLLPSADEHAARDIAEALRRAVEALAITNEHSRVSKVLTISIGVACVTSCRGTTPESFVRMADEALYEAKRHGGNRVCMGPGVMEAKRRQ